jgi:hypothetical protein
MEENPYQPPKVPSDKPAVKEASSIKRILIAIAVLAGGYAVLAVVQEIAFMVVRDW